MTYGWFLSKHEESAISEIRNSLLSINVFIKPFNLQFVCCSEHINAETVLIWSHCSPSLLYYFHCLIVSVLRTIIDCNPWVELHSAALRKIFLFLQFIFRNCSNSCAWNIQENSSVTCGACKKSREVYSLGKLLRSLQKYKCWKQRTKRLACFYLHKIFFHFKIHDTTTRIIIMLMVQKINFKLVHSNHRLM